jgi:hypothetical protein
MVGIVCYVFVDGKWLEKTSITTSDIAVFMDSSENALYLGEGKNATQSLKSDAIDALKDLKKIMPTFKLKKLDSYSPQLIQDEAAKVLKASEAETTEIGIKMEKQYHQIYQIFGIASVALYSLAVLFLLLNIANNEYLYDVNDTLGIVFFIFDETIWNSAILLISILALIATILLLISGVISIYTKYGKIIYAVVIGVVVSLILIFLIWNGPFYFLTSAIIVGYDGLILNSGMFWYFILLSLSFLGIDIGMSAYLIK